MAIDFDTEILPLYASNVITDSEYTAIPAIKRDQSNEQRILTVIEIVKSLMATVTSRREARTLHDTLIGMLADTTSSVLYNDIVTRAVGNVILPSFSVGQGATVVPVGSAPFAVITGTVTVATSTTTFPGWAITDTISINDGSGANVVALNNAGGSPTSIAADINADAGIIADGITADALNTPTGWTVRIRKTVTTNNSLTLANGAGTPLADIGLAAGPVTGSADNVVLATGGDLNTTITEINTLLVNATEVEAYNDGNRLAFRNTSGNEGDSFTLSGDVLGFSQQAGIELKTYEGPVTKVASDSRDAAISTFSRDLRVDTL